MPKSAELIKIVVMISVTLFFFQGLRTIFSSLFGIIYDQVFEGPTTLWVGTSSLLLIAALVAPSFVSGRIEKNIVPLAIALCALARLTMALNRTEIRYWSALLVVLAGAFLIRAYLERMPREAIIAIFGALILGQLLRNLGSTYDISLRPSWLLVQAVWTALLLGALIWARPELPEEARSPGWLVGLAFGAFLFLELSLLNLPNGVSRWSNGSYAVLVPALIAVTVVPLIPAVWDWVQIWLGTSLASRALVAAVLIVGLAIGYFRQGTLVSAALLLVQLSLLLSMVVLFGLERTDSQGGGWIAFGFVLFLALNYFNAFAFTYPYTLPAMRGLGWAVYLVGAVVVGGALLATPRSMEPLHSPALAFAAVGGLALVVSAVAAFPRSYEELSGSDRLTFATYNIHYGYDGDWNFTLEEQAEAIRASGADVIALQEVDAGRLTSYSVDDALYLGRKLGMQVAYLPTIEHLTGIALLYRGPEVRVSSWLLTSDLEQTGMVSVRLPIGTQAVGVYSIWVGLEPDEADRQIREALDAIDVLPRIVLAGDFNLEHGDPALEQMTEAGFIDPFLTLGIEPPPATHPAVDPAKQIDFVWMRGLSPSSAEVAESIASDHRLVSSSASQLP